MLCHHPELKSSGSVFRHGLQQQGRELENIARSLFPHGLDARSADDAYAFTEANWRTDGRVIFEAHFKSETQRASVDILINRGDHLELIEIKSSTSVKNHYVSDLSFQYLLLKEVCKMPVKPVLWLVNNQYERGEELDPSQLFTAYDLSKKVKRELGTTRELLRKAQATLSAPQSPEVPIGAYCTKPHECDLMNVCWAAVEDDSILYLARGMQKKWDWYYEGIDKLEALPASAKLSSAQAVQVKTAINGKPHIELDKIRQFLRELQFPLIHLDFESFNSALPLFPGSKPFEHLPFQYSIHIQDEALAAPRHLEFIAAPGTDPRLPMLEQLIADTKGEGTILAYNLSFEKQVLNRLAQQFPLYREALMQRTSRMKDLMLPFQKQWYYTREMNGSASIKNVLPAIIPELKHSDLAISDGATASNVFLQFQKGKGEGDWRAIRKDLLAYCELDTLAMVKLLDALFALVNDPK